MIFERWSQHFDELLNGSIEFELEEVAIVIEVSLETEVTPPTMEGVELAVKKLKHNKAPGIDLIQVGLDVYKRQLTTAVV